MPARTRVPCLVKTGAYYPWLELPEAHLRWQRRSQALIQHILSVDADVVCLQEVDHYDFWLGAMRDAGYDGTVADESAAYGVVIFWRAMLSCTRRQTVKYDAMVRSYSDGMGPEELKASAAGLQRMLTSRHALVVDLVHETTRRQIRVATTHLFTSKSRNSPALRVLQLQELLAAVASARASGGSDIVLCGDFNDTCHAPTYELLSSGQVACDRVVDLGSWPSCCTPPLGVFKSPLARPLPSAYATLLGCEPSHHGRDDGCIEFLHSTFPVAGVLAWTDDWVHRAVPHEAFPSDHLPIAAQYELQLNKADAKTSAA